MQTDYIKVTEIAGDYVSKEQVTRLCNRYYWAGKYCTGKDVIEAACGCGQGLGYLHRIAQSLIAGDYSKKIFDITKSYYGNRVSLQQFDAQNMPFEQKSKDVIILFEAIYYLPDAERFVKECARVLRPGGVVLVATANKDLYDFNPSPHSFAYYGTVELNTLFADEGFRIKCFGDTPVKKIPLRQKVFRPIKKMAVSMHLIPKTAAGKIWLKRIVFGNIVKMPFEISQDTTSFVPPVPLNITVPDRRHKVLLCEATLLNPNSSNNRTV